MDSREASDRSKRLLANVERMHDLLLDAGDEPWSDAIDAVFRELFAHDAHGLDRLLSYSGGMGSLNDLVLSPVNGHRIEESQVSSLNEELDALRRAVFDDARELRRALADGSER